MKNLFSKSILAIILSVSLVFSGCSVVRPANQNTKNQDKIATAVQKSQDTQSKLNKADVAKIESVATYAFGVNYSLSQVTNVTPPVATALELNGRIISIVGSPALDDMNKIKQIVNLLNSEVQKERDRGQELLSAKDNQIILLQGANKDLKTQYESQINELINKSKDIARTGDNAQATLSEMSGNFGLNAIWWGMKHLFVSFLTYILIFGIIFFILRAFAASNPIVGTIFSIFGMIGGGIISVIKGLVPDSIDFSNLVKLDTHNKYKDTLDKIVDTIEQFKIKCEAANKQCSLADVLDELDRAMDQKDKDCIKQILKDQKWN
jgi:xanthosine utilization system XapX-like protein